MRHGRAAKQRLWLGAIGHFCGCQRRLTKPDSNSNRDSNCHRNTNSHGDCNCNRNSDDHAGSDCETYPNAQATSHTSVEAIRRISERLVDWPTPLRNGVAVRLESQRFPLQLATLEFLAMAK